MSGWEGDVGNEAAELEGRPNRSEFLITPRIPASSCAQSLTLKFSTVRFFLQSYAKAKTLLETFKSLTFYYRPRSPLWIWNLGCRQSRTPRRPGSAS
jgi:hypothetical protein